jgi:Domain of unknown function (DUF4263)
MRRFFDLDPNGRVPDKILGQVPVSYDGVDYTVLRRFSAALKQAETDRAEAPMQRFFEKYPEALVLSLVGARRAWVFPRLALQRALGGGFEVDFLLCDWASLGPEWTLIELESPTKRPLSANGISGACRHAQQQISDYRRTLQEHTERNNIEGLLSGHRQKRSWIIIGRRIERSSVNRDRLADLRRDGIKVASYDRILHHLQQAIEFRIGRLNA